MGVLRIVAGARGEKAGEVMGELKQTFFLGGGDAVGREVGGGGGKVMCITRGQPIGWHRALVLHRLHSAPAAETYLAPSIMHAGRRPPRAQACRGRFPSTSQPNSTFGPKRTRAAA